MSHENNEILSELESALASLSPSTSQLQSGAERDRLMYLAGRASIEIKSAPRRSLSVMAWPLATAAMALIAVFLGTLLVRERQLHRQLLAAQPEQRQHEAAGESNREEAPSEEKTRTGQAISASAPAEGDSLTASALASYLRLRTRVLREGVEALPNPGGASSQGPPDTLTPRSPLELLDG